MRFAVWFVSGATVMTLLLAAQAAGAKEHPRVIQSVSTPIQAKEPPQPVAPVQAVLSVEAIARKTLPALVTVLVKDARAQLIKSGSGFFVAPQRVVTNLHVISGGGTISVVTLDKKEFVATSAGVDELHDLAVLECPDATSVATLSLGDIADVAIGESVVAAGSPLGMEGTISAGIVSAKRDVKGVVVIQTTAPISQGSSGGPLINTLGQVIGVNSFMAADGQNLNFAQLSSHVAALLRGSDKIVDFRRGESFSTKPDKPDPNQNALVALLAQPQFSGSEFKQSLIGNAELVLFDTIRRQVYFALSRAETQDGNDQARLNAAVAKFVADADRVVFASEEGMQARFANFTFRRSPDKWVFFSTDLDNIRLRTDGLLRFKYKDAEYTVSTGELSSFLANSSVRGGSLTVDASRFAKEIGKNVMLNWGPFVALPGEPSLSRFVDDLTKGISDNEQKIQRLTDFVANEIPVDPLQPPGIAKRASEVLMTQRGNIPQKAILLASLLEQIPTEYVLVYSGGQDMWVAVPQGHFKNDNFLGFAFSGRQWTLIELGWPGYIIGQTKSLAPPSLDRLLFVQYPQQQWRIYRRTTGMPLGSL